MSIKPPVPDSAVLCGDGLDYESGSPLLDPSAWPLFPFLRLLPPLPLYQDWDEMPQVEFRPETLQEEDRSILVTLPQHEVAEPLNTASADKQVQWRIARRIHVVRQCFCSDCL